MQTKDNLERLRQRLKDIKEDKFPQTDKVIHDMNPFMTAREPELASENLQGKTVTKEPSAEIKKGPEVNKLAKAAKMSKDLGSYWNKDKSADKPSTPAHVSPKIKEGKYTNTFNLGETKSGKKIMSDAGSPAHEKFSAQDHQDAYFAHGNRMKELEPSQKGLKAFHREQMRAHWAKRNSLLDMGQKLGDKKKVLKSLQKAMVPMEKAADLSAKQERCVHDIKAKNKAEGIPNEKRNPWAICQAKVK